MKKEAPKGIGTSLTVTHWPHIRGQETVEKQMIGVIVALLPATLISIWVFGNDAARVLFYSIAFCVIFEAIGIKLFHNHDPLKRTIMDYSAVVSGMLLAFNLPTGIPFWAIMVGALVAMLIGKHVYGGLGQNPFNPVLVARVFLLAAFPVHMTRWPEAAKGFSTWGADVVTKATPLGMFKVEGFQAAKATYSYADLAIGSVGGCLGETSAIALLLGGIYLIYKGIIRPTIPAAYIGTFGALSLAAWLINAQRFGDPIFHILAGGILLGAFFMATDLVTSPLSFKAMVIYGAGCGLLNFIIRYFGGYPEGTSFAILIMNGLAPLIDRSFRPPRFGTEKKAS